ncbi:MAG: hypothetical protein AMS20_07775 [Gemmatimonas sp. SG8_28]|jgi:hypothetical protein|nr:MAG: hypothetical protein AMS20_07775 [Gemmatimonas sp. SG8_28]
MATYELRSLSLGEILDGAFAIYRHQFWTFVTIAIACEGIPTLVNAYVLMGGGWMMHPILGLVGFVLALFGSFLAAGAIVRAIGAAYLGRQLPAGDALRFALGRIWPLFVAGTSAYLLIGLGAIALLVPGVILACGYSVIAQVVMLEDLPGGTDALPRSWQLTKGYKGKALGLGIVIMLLFLLPALVAGFLIVLFPVSEVVINIAGELFQMLVYPVFAAAFTLFYYDLRVRKEAFDVELLGHQLGLSDSATW